MRVLVTRTTSAPNYGWALALKELGHEVFYWDIRATPAFDVFSEFAPQIIIAEACQINKGLFKCLLKYSAQLKSVALWLRGWTALPQYDWIDKSIMASDAERETVLYLKDKLPLLGLVYTSGEFACNSHFMWDYEGKVNYVSTQPACCLPKGNYREELACDIVYCGARTKRALAWIPKICNLDYKVKIFSKWDDEVIDWGLAQYLGQLSPQDEADAYASAKVSLALLERQDYLPNEAPYNIVGAGGSCLCTESRTIKNVFELDENISYFYKPEDVWFKVENCAHYKKFGMEEVRSEHTYINRVKKALAGVL